MLRKESAEIINEVILNATSEEVDYILRKMSKSYAAAKAAKKAKKAAGQAKKAAKKAKNFMFGGGTGTGTGTPLLGYNPTGSNMLPAVYGDLTQLAKPTLADKLKYFASKAYGSASSKVKGAFNLNNLKIGPKTFPGDPDTKAIKKAQEGLAALGVSGLAGAGIYANTKRLQNQKEENSINAKLKKLNPIK